MSSSMNAQLLVLRRWLSTAYMTWALMGLVHKKGRSTEGWAWIQNDGKKTPPTLDSTATEAPQGGSVTGDLDGGSAFTATAMAQFVENALRQLDAKDSQKGATGAAARPFDAVAMAAMGAPP
jgi:hypothetical protein